MKKTFVLSIALLFFLSCDKERSGIKIAEGARVIGGESNFTAAVMPNDKTAKALSEAQIPEDMAAKIKKAAEDPLSAFNLDLKETLSGDSFLYRLIDKKHPLPEGYEPIDLITLKDGSYKVSKTGLKLRREAELFLAKMAEAARAAGVTLVVSSTYRSETYQRQVYERIAAEMGTEAADRESARPGYSQHQSGLAVDFGSITDEFAATAAGRWLKANASKYGFTISFPDGYESVTGYRWESWHYRYMGLPLARLTDAYFGGIQQYALQFISAYTELN